MKRPEHISAASSGMTPRRILSIGFVGILHIALIWALLNGFARKVEQYLPPVLEAHVIDTQQQPQQKVLPPPPAMVKPTEPQVAPPPEIQIQTPPPQAAISAPPQQPANNAPVNASAMGISSTHSTPPYPPMARRMGEQGIVRLKIMVTPQGTVSDAQVEQSSGYKDLDQTAVEWVKTHWRYKPAMQNGMAVASTTEAIVKFDLKNAH